jgi:hypothetical protein
MRPGNIPALTISDRAGHRFRPPASGHDGRSRRSGRRTAKTTAVATTPGTRTPIVLLSDFPVNNFARLHVGAGKPPTITT